MTLSSPALTTPSSVSRCRGVVAAGSRGGRAVRQRRAGVVTVPDQGVRIHRRRIMQWDSAQVAVGGPEHAVCSPTKVARARESAIVSRSGSVHEVGTDHLDDEPERGREVVVETRRTRCRRRCRASRSGAGEPAGARGRAASAWRGPVSSWTGSSWTRVASMPSGSCRRAGSGRGTRRRSCRSGRPRGPPRRRRGSRRRG